MLSKLHLNRTQLKLIAIVSMVIDHVAWAFVDFYSPLGQFLHVLGRFTIPIMSFFIAEGFRRTHDLRQYFNRLAAAAVISIIPFYLFFGHEYGYRQNIIFDYLLGLMMLIILEEERYSKWVKGLLVGLLFVISATVGGWIITPSLFILAFYYGRTFAEKAKWFIAADITTVIFIETAIFLNSRYHFSHYEWTWWSMLYHLGFMLALPLLYLYNGEKGPDFPRGSFYYTFYPAHMLVLWLIRKMTVEFKSIYGLYLGMHIIIIVAIIIMLEAAMNAQTSKGQNAICTFLVSSFIYVIGFTTEILASTAEGYYLACIVQYFGEFMLFIAALLFISECCLVEIPRFVYMLHIVAAMVLMFMLVTTRETGFFYSYIGVNTDHEILRPELVHSTGFWLAMGFVAFICLEIAGLAIYIFVKGSPIEKKRMRLILWAIVFCWLPFIVTSTGVTGGFEIPAVGIMLAGALLYRCFFHYGIMDSVALASENALDKAREGIMVVDDRYHISFHNRIVDDIVGDIPHNSDVRKNDILNSILSGECTQLTVAERIYETSVETIEKNGYFQGYMIWFMDATEHMANLQQIQDMARHDALTGLFNRTYFKEMVDLDVSEGRTGCFLMMDMDNFKMINDCYGHQRGDSVLKNLAKILAEYPADEMLSCRVGGDEFCVYLRDNTDRDQITSVINNIMESFGRTFRAEDEVKCTISIGAVINDRTDCLMDCSTMYSVADGKLYESKEAGKNTYRI